MSYIIPYTDQTNKGYITVEDGEINDLTSLKIPGRNVTSYGSAIGENFLHLLENFAANTAPSNPVEGQIWYDSSPDVEQVKVFNGANWVPTSSIKKSETEPDASQALIGDLWADIKNQQLYLYTGSGWILVGPEFSDGLATGVSPVSILGTDNINYNILRIDVSAEPIAIVSKFNFTPKNKIPGFSVLYPGLNLSTTAFSGQSPNYIGTAEKAKNLIVNDVLVSAENFLRADTTSTTTYPINVQNNIGIRYGINSELIVGVEGNAGLIQHNVAGSSLDFKVKTASGLKTIVRYDSNLKVGINTVAPEETLDVVGNVSVRSDSSLTDKGNLYVKGTTNTSSANTGALVVNGGVGIAKNLQVGEKIIVNGIDNVAIESRGNILPDINSVRNIGSTDLRFSHIYSNEFTGNLNGNVNGTVTGRAGFADKLTSPTSFVIQGDFFTTNEVSFDGQTGGTTKVFNVEVANTLLASKPQVYTTQADDEFLINRISGINTGLQKVSRQTILQAVPTIPVGMLAPFAGQIAPSGWLICAGQEISKTKYYILFEVIGYSYKAQSMLSSADNFGLPDFRGRVPLGADNMGGSSADVVNDLAADTVGAKGGSASALIEIGNLPEHKHSLSSSSGAQFYAIRDIFGESNDAGVVRYDSPESKGADGLGGGQALSNSGNIETDGAVGAPINIMNPYTTINYIIYAGLG